MYLLVAIECNVIQAIYTPVFTGNVHTGSFSNVRGDLFPHLQYALKMKKEIRLQNVKFMTLTEFRIQNYVPHPTTAS